MGCICSKRNIVGVAPNNKLSLTTESKAPPIGAFAIQESYKSLDVEHVSNLPEIIESRIDIDEVVRSSLAAIVPETDLKELPVTKPTLKFIKIWKDPSNTRKKIAFLLLKAKNKVAPMKSLSRLKRDQGEINKIEANNMESQEPSIALLKDNISINTEVVQVKQVRLPVHDIIISKLT